MLGFDSHNPANNLRDIYKAIVDEFKKYPPTNNYFISKRNFYRKLFDRAWRYWIVGCGPKQGIWKNLSDSGSYYKGVDLVEEMFKLH